MKEMVWKRNSPGNYSIVVSGKAVPAVERERDGSWWCSDDDLCGPHRSLREAKECFLKRKTKKGEAMRTELEEAAARVERLTRKRTRAADKDRRVRATRALLVATRQLHEAQWGIRKR